MLEIINISKTFLPGTVNERKALDNVSFRMEDGEFITIIGSNGAGKSTLLSAIAGSFPTDRGKVILDGEDISSMPEYKRSRSIGRLFQDPLSGTAPGLTIEENMALVYLQGKKTANSFSRIGKEEREMFRERLRPLDLGLEDRLEQPVGLLSGGQRQALTLLLATLYPPKLLMLDEHTAALDPGSAERIMTLTKDIVRENRISCLMVTHNMRQALDAGSRTLIMNAGKIVADISGDERAGMDVGKLTDLFRNAAGSEYANDRMILSS
ncbi:MAG: ATP-binding cassette domain-containing protein [Oscillospiraceae bacterium]|nr:ATP-binding cassette domain-containing protein [Oscillospiraceae bacterium]MBR5065622.1 ATP-binding cassette domain-containing protein [Oscillospiraceae bacterium]